MEKKMTEMTETEFAEHVSNWGCSCDVGSGYGCGHIAIRDELLRRLGAAVSASPQPRCPKCGAGQGKLALDYQKPITSQDDTAGPYVHCEGCGTKTFTEMWRLWELAPFFAPAPAQEPHCGYWLSEAKLNELASGASTGEQPPRHKCVDCDATEMLTVIGPKQYACPTHLFKGASRPSEPSAPKVEPPIQRHYAIIGDYSSIDGATRKEACGYRSCGKPYSDPIHIQPEEMAHEAGSQPRKPLSYEEAKKVATQATETASAPRSGNGEYCNWPGDFTDGLPYCQQCGLKSRAPSATRQSGWLKETLTEAAARQARYEAATKDDYMLYAAAPSVAGTQPTWIRQESCSECDGDGCAKCQTLKDRIAELLKLGSGDEDGPSEDAVFDYVNALRGAAQGTPQVEEASREIEHYVSLRSGDWGKHAGSYHAKAIAEILRKHLPGAPAQPGQLKPQCPNCRGSLSFTHNKVLTFLSCNGRCKKTFELHSADDMAKFFTFPLDLEKLSKK